jgi:CheY-like chemotaxis protein/anti-sigma regulatory factor (Ser/Thr protein kinase)
LPGFGSELNQVWTNLIDNAVDAMGASGTITITTGHGDGWAVVTIEDDGPGIPAEHLSRVFDPFFTTKEPGKGTGLGLSTSLAIVRSHGGFFDVRSAPGAGSTFVVHRPASAGRRREPAERETPAVRRGQGELILVVDDEAGIREITRRMLEAFGYRVVLAADGAEAVEIFSSRRHEISAVLTDMMMPVMDGAAAIRAMRTIDPAVRLVTVSGLTPGHAAAAETGRTGRPPRHLPKPYTAEQLLRVLEAVLDGAA